MTPTDRIKRLLTALRGSEAEIAAGLRRSGCRGSRHDPKKCPIFRYIAADKELIPSKLFAFSTHLTYDGVKVFYPSAVRRVAQDFDAGLLPELERN